MQLIFFTERLHFLLSSGSTLHCLLKCPLKPIPTLRLPLAVQTLEEEEGGGLANEILLLKGPARSRARKVGVSKGLIVKSTWSLSRGDGKRECCYGRLLNLRERPETEIFNSMFAQEGNKVQKSICEFLA